MATRRGRRTPVKEARDISVCKRGQDLAFLPGSATLLRIGMRETQHFDRNRLLEFVVVPHGAVHSAHSAQPDSAGKPVRTYSPPGKRCVIQACSDSSDGFLNAPERTSGGEPK